MEAKRINLPLQDKEVRELKRGDRLLLSGTLYTARDAAHKRLLEAMEKGKELPIALEGQIIYYTGPTPPPPGKVIGSAGPTTSTRMDSLTIPLLERGLKGMIGKGSRSQEIKKALQKFGALYMAAVGGAGAFLSQKIKTAELVAFEDLGPEAIYQLKVEDFPVVVINDVYGGDLYEEGKAQYARENKGK
ncbi:MAG: Fe-S-containing hydro-lyase [Candidatus Syntrophonatronum acetioxidans]|uniref:Fe-S-containing hydro-lyase n=1 Tax=Candidatus Syntrophonatronum acetioxidans TaxID=1795816 RepID=A0A424YAM8_9FIRM|nr:MAG: Fe-S-containing hydro-lyase [Candidatus Syntrophonatronum acetioxidans]